MGKWDNRAPKGALYKWLLEHQDYDGDDCLKWPYNQCVQGRGLVTVDGKNRLAPRVMCELVNGPPPTSDYDAAHLCGKGHEGCLSPKHLIWKTRKENVDDTMLHGTKARGEKMGSAKLTKAQVLEIRRRAPYERYAVLSEEFGVGIASISMIRHRKHWSWLGDDGQPIPGEQFGDRRYALGLEILHGLC